MYHILYIIYYILYIIYYVLCIIYYILYIIYYMLYIISNIPMFICKLTASRSFPRRFAIFARWARRKQHVNNSSGTFEQSGRT